jgi:hypothetical protein
MPPTNAANNTAAGFTAEYGPNVAATLSINFAATFTPNVVATFTADFVADLVADFDANNGAVPSVAWCGVVEIFIFLSFPEIFIH